MAPRRSSRSRASPIAESQRVCVGEIGAAHGIRGEVRLHAFTTDPMSIAQYGALDAEDGRSLTIEAVRPAKNCLVARFAGITDRTAAARLRNLKLYVPRERLPGLSEPETYYYADLIGLPVVGPDGITLGSVMAIHDFGAGDLIEVKPADGGPTVLLPFTRAVVPVVDVAGRRLVVDAPEGTFNPPSSARR